ncbi:MAG: ABC transporter ATP-binding protein [bacterium]
MQAESKSAAAHAPSLAIEGITKRFGTVTALDAVSLEIHPGELFFLLGPSGCGKTTLLRILAGLERPDAGIIRFDGEDVARRPPYLRGAPMVFQNYALWPHLTVGENVAFGLVERRVARHEIATRVAATLARVGLVGLDRRRPGQLSGGQQQRVVLARALVLNPGVILLDEPLSNLDARLRLEMREAIQELHTATAITFVYVTHDQAEALSLADRMAVMADGRVQAVGTPAELYHRPPTVFCADFLGEANLFPGRVRALSGNNTVTVETDAGILTAVTPATPPAPGARVVVMVRPEALQPVVHAAAGGSDNLLTARVTATRLNGATLTVSLAVGTLTLKATCLNQPQALPRIGDIGPWQISASAAVVLPPAGGSVTA